MSTLPMELAKRAEKQRFLNCLVCMTETWIGPPSHSMWNSTPLTPSK